MTITTIEADSACRYLVVYAPAHRDFIAPRADHARDRRIQSWGGRRSGHGHACAAARRRIFLYDARHGLAGLPMTTTPFTCVLDVSEPRRVPRVVGARQGAVLGRHRRAVAQPFRPGDRPQHRHADARSIGSFALRAPAGFIVALRSGIWLARADGTLDRRILAAPYDPAHHRFNDGRCDPAGRFFVGYMNEKRDAHTAALMRVDADGTHDARCSPTSRSATALRGARTAARCITPTRRRTCPRVRLRRRDRTPSQRAHVRAVGRRDRPARRRRRSTAQATTGARSTAAARWCRSRRAASRSRSIRSPRCAPRCARSADPIFTRSTSRSARRCASPRSSPACRNRAASSR